MSKRVLILGAGQMQVPIIECVNSMNYYSIVADMDPNAPGFQYAKESLFISTLDYELLLEYCKEHPVDGVLTTSDYPVNVVAKISSECGLKAMSVDTANWCTNKFLQRERLKISGINTPSYVIVRNALLPDEILKEITFPVVVKPVDSSASRGVQRVNDITNLYTAVEDANIISKTNTVIVEDFIEGREYSVETFTQNGETKVIAITEKQIIGEEYGCFVEDTHVQPAKLDEILKLQIIEEIEKVTKALLFDNCPGHIEIKLNKNGINIIEAACRLGGDYITSDLVPLSTGVNMLECLVYASLGETIDLNPKVNKNSAIQFINTTNYARCVDFISSGNKNIQRAELLPYSSNIIKSSLDRLGYIILQTDTFDELDTILKGIK